MYHYQPYCVVHLGLRGLITYSYRCRLSISIGDAVFESVRPIPLSPLRSQSHRYRQEFESLVRKIRNTETMQYLGIQDDGVMEFLGCLHGVVIMGIELDII